MLRERLRAVLFLFPAALADLGIVDREKGEEAFDLAIPVMVTGGLRVLVRMADFLMVGIALGDAAIAALELGFQYYFVPFGLSLALTSGTISVVSRYVGAGRPAAADFAVKQSLWLALLVSVPITVAAWRYATPLLDLLTNDPAAIRMGADYLRVVMLSVSFRFWSLIAARALAGAGNTRTPMYVRLLTLPTNVTLNALLVFGLGPFPKLDVVGAAVGTTVANTLAGLVFFAILLSGRWDVRLRVGGKQWDWTVAREIVRVGLPLAGTRLARTFGRFPFLFILGVLGTPYVAAYAIGRRVVLMAMMPAWGYATAASTLVGQSVGGGDDASATDYGWQTARIAIVTQLFIAALLVLFAAPIARAFGTQHVDLTVSFVRMWGLAVGGFSISRTMRGALRGAGDMRWPFYGTLVGTYLVKLPVAALALPVGFGVTVAGVTLAPGMGLGLTAVFAAILGDIYLKAVVNTARFATGRWKAVARASAVSGD